MGAEVIKIESQVYIDIGRINPAGHGGSQRGTEPQRLLPHAELRQEGDHAESRDATKGRELADEIIRKSDFVLECFPTPDREEARPHL